MSDFVTKYKNTTAGVKPRQQNKDQKKGVTKALHTTFKAAMEGQLAGIQHEGVLYYMMRQDVFNKVVQNGGLALLTEEQQEFHKHYQILMHMMESLDIEVEEESVLFDKIDQFTFDFSQHMNDPNGAKKRREIVKEFHEVVASSELLTSIEKNLRNQFFPDENETKEVENAGKLT